jgi:hypothetical protein
VAGHRHEPPGEGRRIADVAELAPGPREDVLDHVAGVGRADPSQGHRMDRAMEALVERREGPAVSALRGHHQLGDAGVGRGCHHRPTMRRTGRHLKRRHDMISAAS